MSILKSKNLQFNLLAIVLFVITSLALCYPVLQGKRLNQSDIKQFSGGASEIFDYRESENRDILWTSSMFSGMPTNLISLKYESELLRKIPWTIRKIFPGRTGVIFLLMLGFYFLMLALKVDARLAIIGSIAYGLSSYLVVYYAAGHNSKVHAMAYLPGILAGLIWLYRHKNIYIGLTLTILFSIFEIQAGHPQMLYYFLFVILGYIIFELINYTKNKELVQFVKISSFATGAAILAVLASYSYLSTTSDFGKKTIRGKSELTFNQGDKTKGLDRSYVTNWSYGIQETMSLFIPNFKGGESKIIGNDKKILKNVSQNYKQSIAGQNQYWGDQPFTSGPAYAGVLVFAFFILGLFIVKDNIKYVFLFGLIITTMLAWGKNFPEMTNFFLDNVPLYNKFRAVNSLMVIAQFCFPVLAIICLNKLSNTENWKDGIRLNFINKSFELKKVIWTVFGFLAVVCLVGYVSPDSINTFLSLKESETLSTTLLEAGLNAQQADIYTENLISARSAIFKSDVLRSLFFLLTGGVLLWLFISKRLNRNTFLILTGLIIVADSFSLDRRYLNKDKYVDGRKIEKNYGVVETKADVIIKADKDPHFRVLNLTVSPFNDATTSFFHKSIGGYHGAKLKIYQEFIEYQLSGDMQKIQKGFSERKSPEQVFASTNGLNMLNMKYLIVSESTPVENPKRLGNAWFVNKVKYVSSADEEILSVDKINPANEVILRDTYKDEFTDYSPIKDSLSAIKLVSYDPEKLVYSSNNSNDGLAVFSEIYYPGTWKAYIDDKEVDILRANYIQRAIKVPAGNHEVKMVFEDELFESSSNISLIGSILVLILIGGLMFVYLKKKPTQKEE